MARSRRSRRTLTVVVLVVLSLSLISLDLNGRTHSLTSGIKSVANDIYSPLRGGVADIISPIGNFFAGAFNYGAVQAENEQLQKAIGQLRATQAEKGFQQNQLRELTQLENLPYLNRSPVTAQTKTSTRPTSPPPSPSTRDATTGSTSAIRSSARGAGRPGHPVVPPQQRRAADHRRAVEDRRGVRPEQPLHRHRRRPGPGERPDGRPREAAHAGAQGRGHVHERPPGRPYPPGIPVATVSSFHTAAGASQESITVEPSANLNQLAYVDVVQWAPPT